MAIGDVETIRQRSADELIQLAMEYVHERTRDSYGAPLSASEAALLSIAITLREIAAKK